MSFRRVTHDDRDIDGYRALARYMDIQIEHARAGELQILDVRERAECDEGHIPGSAHTPYHDIYEIPEGVDPGRPVAVVCASGRRALHRVEHSA
jgi:rhodanese-related sulfurtransferase